MCGRAWVWVKTSRAGAPGAEASQGWMSAGIRGGGSRGDGREGRPGVQLFPCCVMGVAVAQGGLFERAASLEGVMRTGSDRRAGALGVELSGR
eukprot:193539-Chlamydomonas_euryale.AAC.1